MGLAKHRNGPVNVWWTIFGLTWLYIGRLVKAKIKPGDKPKQLYRILHGKHP